VSRVNGPMYTHVGLVYVILQTLTSLINSRENVKAAIGDITTLLILKQDIANTAHIQKGILLMENAYALVREGISWTQIGNVINVNHLLWRSIKTRVFVHQVRIPLRV